MKAGTLSAGAVLFKPGVAIRFEWNRNTDTPLPPDEPAGQNPPDGAIVDYYLKQPSGAVTLEVLDRAGAVVRRYASDDTVAPLRDEGNVPAYWIRPTRILRADAGLHRFVWDLRYPPPPGAERGFPIAATPGETASEPKGPWVVPGVYTLKLTANGVSLTQPLTVRMDPRVKSGTLALQQQFALAKQVYDALVESLAARTVAEKQGNADRAKKLDAVATQLLAIYPLTQDGSSPPPLQTRAAVRQALKAYESVIAAVGRQHVPLPPSPPPIGL
jgi:hypothetical protein